MLAITRWTIGLSAAVLLGNTAHLAAQSCTTQQDVKLKYSSAQKALTADGQLPELTRGCGVAIRFTGDPVPTDWGTAWKFAAGAAALTPANDHLTYQVSSDAPASIQFTVTGVAMDPVDLRVTGPNGNTTVQAVFVRAKLVDGDNDRVNLYFNESGLPDSMPAGVTDNETINVYLYLPNDDNIQNYAVQVTGTVRGEGVTLLGQGALSQFASLGKIQSTGGGSIVRTVYFMGSYGPFSAPSVTITVSKSVSGGSPVQHSQLLRVRTTYIGSLRAGLLVSRIALNSFAVAQTSGGAGTTIQNTQGHAGEVRPVLAVVFYGWQFWKKHFWEGRSEEDAPTLVQRINPVAGVGLRSIGNEFLLGGSIELARGLDVMYARHFVKVSELGGGFHEGDAFSGTAGQIPLREEWHSNWVMGASADLRIVTSLMSGLFGQSK